MDDDPELDVTLTNGRRVRTFQIAAVAEAEETWTVFEPGGRRDEIRGRAAALATRARLDQSIAARLAAGWVPVDGSTPFVGPTALSRDLTLQISSVLEALGYARHALGAADPSGRLWAACELLIRQGWRFGLGAPRSRRTRAQRERRLGELAEAVGDRPTAMLHYRAAIAAYPRIGVKRRVARLTPPASARTGTRSARPTPTATVQIVGRVDPALHAQVRARAAGAGQTLLAFLADALAVAVARPRPDHPDA